jgi:hypothetical protein
MLPAMRYVEGFGHTGIVVDFKVPAVCQNGCVRWFHNYSLTDFARWNEDRLFFK